MTDADPTMVRPIEELAMALLREVDDLDADEVEREWAAMELFKPGSQNYWRELARSGLNRLRELGAFNDQFYDAIKKEAGK